MLKFLSKSIVFVFLAIFIACPQNVYANTDSMPKENSKLQEQMNLLQNDVKVDDLDIEPINTQSVKKNVVPNTHKEAKKIASLFIRVMLMVLLGAGILYLVLLFVRKYYNSAFSDIDVEKFDSLDLSTPQNKKDALVSFLNRIK